MRVSTLSAVCAAALVLPASAAPIEEAAPIAIPGLGVTLTVKLHGPTEVASPELPSVTPPALSPGGGMSQANRLSQSKLLKRPRAADFRQADYGVSPNVTFAAVPVQGLEATPSDAAPVPTNSLRRRSENDWEDARLKPDDYSAAAASPAGDLPDAPDAADAPADAPSVPANPASPLKLGSLQDTNANSLPAQLDASSLSGTAGSIITKTGDARYRSAYAAHDVLGAALDKAQPAMAPSADVAKSPMQLSKLSHGSGSGGLLRRVLEPARYFAGSFRRALDDLTKVLGDPTKGNGVMGKNAKGMGAHTLEVNSDAILPNEPDQTLNMSDPYVAQEEARRQRAGVVNIDSNRPAPRPPAAPPAGDVPLNGTATNGTTAATGALEDGAKDAKDGEKGAQSVKSVKLDSAAKNATGAA
ncbi:hypothetical protein C8Q73DRAFT_791655 [Cubamyces lactineus]|nr:hypothetical protein C8Q73DRAFT_791655 [Cubamyces lactineus]